MLNLNQISNPDSQVVIIDADGSFIIKAILSGPFFVFKVINIYGVRPWIYNPVFPYAGRAVFKKFNAIIHTLRARRDDFNNPVRRSVTPFVIQPVFITDHGNVRLYVIPVILIKEDSKQGRVYFTVTAHLHSVDYSGGSRSSGRLLDLLYTFGFPLQDSIDVRLTSRIERAVFFYYANFMHI